MKKKITLLASLFICAFGMNAQTDITATYLTNADFETTPTFTESNGTANGTLITVNKAQGYVIPGWDTTSDSEYGRSATAKYGITFDAIPSVLNAVNPPTADKGDNADGHVLMLSGGWGATITLTKSVTLPVGKYELVFDVLNQAAGKLLGTNYCGFVPNEGTPVYSTKLDYTGQWTTETIAFTLTEETVGKISLGLKAVGQNSAESARLAIDNVKLLSYAVQKSELEAKIRTAGENFGGVEAGDAYLQKAIAAAQAVYDKANATDAEVLQAIEDLDAALLLLEDATLSDLKVDGKSIAGFNPETLNYIYNIAPSAVPEVSATANGTAAGAVVEVSTIDETTNTITIIVTSGKGFPTQTYTIQFIKDYMAGWDANGSTTQSPYDAGWRTTAADVAWADSDPIDAAKYQYRDNLNVGRVFIHPQDQAAFSYPLTGLEAGKIYTFTCSSAKMSGNNARPTTFSVNTAADGTGTTLGSQSKDAVKWTATTQHSFSFVAPVAGTYYLIWQTETSDGDRSLAWGFKLVQTGEGIAITFDSDGGTTVEPQYLALGDKIKEPEAPVKEGFTFNGWWYDEDGFATKWNFDLGIEGSMLLEARWTTPTSTEEELAEKAFEVITAQNGVNVKANQAMDVKVWSITGQTIKTVEVETGETFIALPAGMYIINGVKTIVR